MAGHHQTGKTQHRAEGSRGLVSDAARQAGGRHAEISGESAERRAQVRQEQARPLLAELKPYLQEQRRRLSAKTNLAKAINYALGRWEDLCLYITDSRIGIDNNPAERALRGIATACSLYPSFLSAWKHLGLVLRSAARIWKGAPGTT